MFIDSEAPIGVDLMFIYKTSEERRDRRGSRRPRPSGVFSARCVWGTGGFFEGRSSDERRFCVMRCAAGENVGFCQNVGHCFGVRDGEGGCFGWQIMNETVKKVVCLGWFDLFYLLV